MHARSGKVRRPAIVNGRFGVGSRAAPPADQAGRRRIVGPFRDVDSEWISLVFTTPSYHETWGSCGDIRGSWGFQFAVWIVFRSAALVYIQSFV